MNATEFKDIYSESRNGVNRFVRHPMARGFHYSDGVEALAECGCYWLLDIMATECAVALRRANEPRSLVTVKVADSKATIEQTTSDDAPPIWKREIGFTDMPAGEWTFVVNMDGDGIVRCILLSEY